MMAAIAARRAQSEQLVALSPRLSVRRRKDAAAAIFCTDVSVPISKLATFLDEALLQPASTLS